MANDPYPDERGDESWEGVDTHPFYNLTLHLSVTDPSALYKAAREIAIADGVRKEHVDLYLKPNGVISISDCLIMLLGPDESPAGCEILESSVE